MSIQKIISLFSLFSSSFPSNLSLIHLYYIKFRIKPKKKVRDIPLQYSLLKLGIANLFGAFVLYITPWKNI